jgi:serine protease
MKKLLSLCLFFVGLFWVLANFGGLATNGKYDSLVLDFREDVAADQIESQVKAIASQYSLIPQLNSVFSKSDHVYTVKGDAALLEKLRKSELGKLTEYIEPNYIYGIPPLNDESNCEQVLDKSASNFNQPNYNSELAPNDPMYAKQWNFRSINIEEAWKRSKGKGITVAVIDTGVSQVEDLKGTKFVKGYDFVNDRENADDDNGHGTHVAGTIAQTTNNGFGVAGIAYEANIMPLKVLSSWGGGTIADIAEAIKFAADNGADVINMSLGGGGESSIMKEAIDYAYKKGVVIIAAAGNSNSNSAGYPARYPRVIGVSATAPNGTKAFYSNYGAGVDIAAPGGETKGKDGGENPDGGILQNTIAAKTGESIFAAYQGTSMAAPHVAGVAALIKASGVKPPEAVLSVLQQSSRKVKDDGQNYYGAGHLDAAIATNIANNQFSWNDFVRWLRDNGYLNPRFWFDGGVVAIIPKLLMVIGSYLVALLLRRFFPFAWSWSFSNGLFFGSAGLFLFRGLYIFDLPQWPMRLLGSSIPELGSFSSGTSILNPIFASVLLPFALILLLTGHRNWRWFAIGSSIGVGSCLAISAVTRTEVLWLGEGIMAQSFLAINAFLCIAIAHLSLKAEASRV